MNWRRRFAVLGLALTLLIGVSCTTENSPTGISSAEPVRQASPVLIGGLLDSLGGAVGGLGGPVDGALDGVGDAVDDLLGGAGDATGGGIGGLGGGLAGAGGGLGGTVNDLLGGAVSAVGNITDLLTCKEQKYVSVTETIGSQGGRIRVGEHTLLIPQGALTKKVKIRAEQMRGRTNSVRFSPEGLRFEKPAALTMSYKNCVLVLLPKSIVYTTEKFKILEVLRSLDLFRRRTVTAPIDHFSRYAVAF